MVKFLKSQTVLTRVARVLRLFTLVAYTVPFFRSSLGNIAGGFTVA